MKFGDSNTRHFSQDFLFAGVFHRIFKLQGLAFDCLVVSKCHPVSMCGGEGLGDKVAVEVCHGGRYWLLLGPPAHLILYLLGRAH